MAEAPSVYQLFESSFHINEITGCYLWDGDTDKNGPIAEFLGSRVKFRDLLLRQGDRDPAQFELVPLCENPRCIRLEHMKVAERTDTKPADVAYTEEELAKVKQLTSEGFRQDIIADRLQTSRSRIAKMVRVLKNRAKENAK